MLHSISQHSHDQRRFRKMQLSPANTNVQDRSRISLSVSISAMGWASMLLLASSASAFNADVTRTRIPIPQIPNAARPLATQHVAPTRRQYGASNGFHSTRLNYRDTDDGEPIERQQEHNNASGVARWWSTIVHPEDQVDEKQRRVDDYLEYLDKRYHRIHEKEESNKSGFSVMNWLMDSAENDQESMNRQNEDALHVLGLAELASDRLLQKHNLDKQQVSSESLRQEAKSRDFIDATIVEQVNTSAVRPVAPIKSTIMVAGMVEALAAVLKELQVRRNMLIRYQRKKLQALVALLARTFAKAPKTAVSLYKLGGGSKTVALTATCVAAAFFVMRPVVQGMVYEAAYRG